MTRVNTMCCGVLSLLFVVSAAAEPQPRPTISEITATLGGEAQARIVFKSVLSHLFQQEEGKEVLLSDQIRPEWLPQSDRVQFVLTTEGNTAKVSDCNMFWRVTKVERAANVITIRLDQHCGATMREYKVTPEGSLIGSPGIGSGFLGRPPEDCPCVQR